MVASTRRQVLLGAGAAGLSLPLLASAPLAKPGPRVLTAKPGSVALLGLDAPPTPIWAYDGATPGPVLRVKQGEELSVRLVNGLPEATTIHWHGLRIANAMDGVPGVTQEPVPPGASFDYRFTPPDAGTFWYHPHARSFEQVARGLAGALIVEEPDPPKADQDIVLLIGDFRLDSNGQPVLPFGGRHDQAHAGRLGNHITVNGQGFVSLAARRNERLRLRLINACSARILKILLEGVAPKLIAFDGQPLPPTASYGEVLTLGPGNRADLMLDITQAAGALIPLTDVNGRQHNLGEIAVQAGPPARPEPLVAPIALSPNPIALPARADALPVRLTMTGGAASQTDMTAMTTSGPVWQFNGQAGAAAYGGICTADPPLLRVPRGRNVAVEFVNGTAWPHAMHLHGHHFRLWARQPGPPPEPFWWDTILVDPGQTVLAAFVADNPGKWMLHCHMLDHQMSGMESWFEVTA